MTLYTWLLRLYPASFRHEYAEEMRPLFERRLERASGIGVVVLWLATIGAVAATALAVHADIFKQDLSYTGRTLRRSPGFAITAVAIVALGISATTAAFSVTDFVLLRPLPFHQPDRLVMILETTPGYAGMEFSAPNYRDWKAAATSFESMAVYGTSSVTMNGVGEPRRLAAARVSSELLPTLGVSPIIGRVFTAEDDGEGAPRV